MRPNVTEVTTLTYNTVHCPRETCRQSNMPRITTEVSTELISDVKRWEGIENEWRELVDSGNFVSPAMTWDWLREWWRVYGTAYSTPGGLRIFTFRRGRRLVGLIPLYLQPTGIRGLGGRRLRFISTGEQVFEETCPDYMDLLSLPGEELHCVGAFQRRTVSTVRRMG